MRPRVFVTQPIAASALERLRGLADVTINSDPVRIVSVDELSAAAGANDILFCLLHDTVDARVIASGRELRAIASMKITPSGVDVAAASARRIPVTVIPPIVTEATADLHFGLLLAVARRVVEADRAVRENIFPGGQSSRFAGAGVFESRRLSSSEAAGGSGARWPNGRAASRCAASTGCRGGCPPPKRRSTAWSTRPSSISSPKATSSRSMRP